MTAQRQHEIRYLQRTEGKSVWLELVNRGEETGGRDRTEKTDSHGQMVQKWSLKCIQVQRGSLIDLEKNSFITSWVHLLIQQYLLQAGSHEFGPWYR